MSGKRRLIIAMTGATGAVYGLRLLQVLREIGGWETHLVVSSAGVLNIRHELGMKRSDVGAFADVVHDVGDVGASIASGAFKTHGMIIAPCSMKTLAAVAHGFSDNLISRAADVTLKERRRLVVVPRETPLNLAHIRNMAAVTEMGIVFLRCRRSTARQTGGADRRDRGTDSRAVRDRDKIAVPAVGRFGKPRCDVYKETNYINDETGF